jgi:hypothetical protein
MKQRFVYCPCTVSEPGAASQRLGLVIGFPRSDAAATATGSHPPRHQLDSRFSDVGTSNAVVADGALGRLVPAAAEV